MTEDIKLMKYIKTTDAVGHVLCHDLTQILPGISKGPVFKKGHVVTEEDIPVLLSIGKENLYVWEKLPGILHEDEAAALLRDVCVGDSENFSFSGPNEGKITIRSAVRGLLKIDSDRLRAVNSLGEMMIATVHGNIPVWPGDVLAGTRIIPLVIEEEKLNRAKGLAEGCALLSILPYIVSKTALIITGNEVASGRIKDAFGPVLRKMLAEYDVEIMDQKILADDRQSITKTILEMAELGAELILVSGGMSVDPDDKTPGAIRDTGAAVISYGAPVLPGAMFLMAYLEHAGRKIPVMGLPGCVMYNKRTIFDLVLPRVLAGEEITSEKLASYGEGGLCLNCETCHFPNCGFGK